jgi:hypothetical protein
MSGIRRAWASGAGVVAVVGIAVGGGPIAPAGAAAPVWTPAQTLPEAPTVVGVLGDGTSVALRLRESSTDSFRGTTLVESRRPLGGSWSQPRRVSRWPAFRCRLGGEVEGPTVAAVVRCFRDNTPPPGILRSFSRAFVWTSGTGWRSHDRVNAPLDTDVSPSGNAVFSASQRRSTQLLVFNQTSGLWNEIGRSRPAGARDTRAAIDNDRDLLLSHATQANRQVDDSRVVVQRRVSGNWRSPRVLDHSRQCCGFAGTTVEVNARGDAVVTWSELEQRVQGTENVRQLTSAVGTSSGWSLQAFNRFANVGHEWDAGISRAGVATLVWSQENFDGASEDTVIRSRTRSLAGIWGPAEVLARRDVVSFGGVDVNSAGRAAVTYAYLTRTAEPTSGVVRLRGAGQTAWGAEHQLTTPGSTFSTPIASVGADGTTTAWWGEALAGQSMSLSSSNESTPPAQ